MSRLTSEAKSKIEQLVCKEYTNHKNICEECYKMGKDDPLGAVSDVDTSTNREINELADRFVQHGYPVLESEARHELVDLFYAYRQSYADEAQTVNTQTECFYCFKSGDTAIQIQDEGKNSRLFEKTETEWL